MKWLYNKFPRELGFPRRKSVAKEEEFYKNINSFNGIKNVYSSVYDCDEGRSYERCTIDKLFFDFDEQDCVYDVVRFSEFLEEKDIKHTIIFSGKKGFHIYIFVKPYGVLKHTSKEVLYNAQTYYINHLKLAVDSHVVGDVARIARVPNTWHMTGNRYCIPISRDEAKEGMDKLKKLADKQKFNFTFYGKNLLDITQFDFECKRLIAEKMPDFDYDLPVTNNCIDNFLPCVKNWLLNPKMAKNRERYFFAVYCRDMGLPPKFCDDIAKIYWNTTKDSSGRMTKYQEFVQERQVFEAYEKKNDHFPNCSSLFMCGSCEGKCDKFVKDGSPLYR